jgi:PGF-pre-PGF domain-containing protein
MFRTRYAFVLLVGLVLASLFVAAQPSVSVVNITPDRHPPNGTTPTTITLNVSGANNVSVVFVSNGTFSMNASLVAGNATNGTYNVTFNLSDFGCAGESVCVLTVIANDSLGNSNDSVNTSLGPYMLYIDSQAPIVVRNLTNLSGNTARVGAHIQFSARWRDVALLDDSTLFGGIGLTYWFMVYNMTSETYIDYHVNSYFGTLYGNDTNYTYTVPPTFEGKPLIALFRMWDSNDNVDGTDDITVYIANESLPLGLIAPDNDSAIVQNDTLVFGFNETGIGINISTIALNITNLSGSPLYFISYAANASHFTCINTSTPSTQNWTCNVTGPWPSGDVIARFSVSDKAGNTNTTAPVFNVTGISLQFSPQTAVNQSVIRLNINVNTLFPNATFCTYNLTKWNATTNTSMAYRVMSLNSSLFAMAGYEWRYYENITGVPDARYNLTVNCSTVDNLSVGGASNFSLNDTTRPTLFGVNASGVDTSRATIAGQADEAVSFQVKYGTNATSLSKVMPSSLDLSHLSTKTTIHLSDLLAGTKYYYNLTACDAKSQCNTSSTFNFTTIAPSTGGGGGGGGGGMPDPNAPGTVEKTDARVWGVMGVNQTLDYRPLANMSISLISMKFTNAATAVNLGVKQFKSKPPTIPDAPGQVYRYLAIDSKNVAGNTERPFVEVIIPKSWMNERGLGTGDIILYRLEGITWVAYPARKTDDLGYDYYFTAVVPGFSFFAVGGQEGVGVSQNTTSGITPNTTANETPNVAPPPDVPPPPQTGAPASNATNRTGGGFVQPNRKPTSLSWLLIAVIAVVVGGGTFFGLNWYRRYLLFESDRRARIDAEKQEVERRKSISVSGSIVGLSLSKPLERRAEHDPMSQLHAYIDHMREKNVRDSEIRERLVAAGWDGTIVDLEMLRK